MDERHRSDLGRQLGLDGLGTDTARDRVRTVCMMVRHQVNVDAVAVSTIDRDWQSTAATDEWAEQLEDYQQLLGEGPSQDAIRSGLAVVTSDVRAKRHRWPMFTERAVTTGVNAVFAVPIPDTSGSPVGALTLYRHTAGPLSTAELRHTAVMVGLTATLVELDPANPATPGITEATDLLVSRHTLTREDALVLLRARAYTQARPVAQIAEAVVNGGLWQTSLDDGLS